MRAPRRIKFVWGASKVIRGRWYLGLIGFYDRVEGVPDGGVAISGRGLLLWGTALGLAAYLSLAGAVFWFWQRDGSGALTYGDAVFYPIRRKLVVEKKGQAFIARGLEALKERRWHDGMNGLRQGLARYPRDRHARLMLAQLYVASDQRPLGLKLLVEGLTSEYPERAYLQALFEIASQGENNALVAKWAEHFRTQLPELKETEKRWLLSCQFGALLADNRETAALELLAGEPESNVVYEQKVTALLAVKKWDEALRELTAWRKFSGKELLPILRLEGRVWREKGRPEELERTLAELRTRFSTDPRVRVYEVVQLVMAQQTASADRALTNFLFRFGTSPDHLLMLAEPLGEVGATSALLRVIAAAKEQGHPLSALYGHLVQAEISRGDWVAATALLPHVDLGSAAKGADQFLFTWTKRLVDAAISPGDNAQLALAEFMRTRAWPMKLYRRTIEVLQRAERHGTARDVAAIGLRSFPDNEWLQHQIKGATEAIAVRVTPVIVADSAEKLPEESFYFEQLGQWLDRAEWEKAEQWIQHARAVRPAPFWIQRRDPDLRFAQMRIGHGRGQLTAVMSAASLYLNTDLERARRVLTFATEVSSQGDRETAEKLTKEILRRVPGYLPAKRQLAEWEPVLEVGVEATSAGETKRGGR